MDRDIEQDFTQFVRDRTPGLFRVAYALTGERHGAEDLLQTALARAAARWSRIHSDPEAYVRRVLYHQHITRWRYRRRRPETLMADVPERGRPGVAHPDPADQTVTRLRLRAALRALPPRQRAVVVLRYLEDLSEREVADVLGCSTGTVASQASRALARLRLETLGDASPDSVVVQGAFQ
ncbi:MAG TPA: SigE family RNA polymerase sigma factor [Micromonosporaceae bacterium]|nr:SigE family RNA polymerase sigma factor [Micromonosporaceae bacterium]